MKIFLLMAITLMICAIPKIALNQNSSTISPTSYSGIISGISILHENDILFYPLNDDDNYTGSLRVDILSTIANKLLPSDLNLSFGVTAFTPQKIGDTLPIYNDRPFASYQYFGVGILNISRRYGMKVKPEISAGYIGGSFADAGQSWLHKNITPGREVPQGWPFQIGNGGNWAINANLYIQDEILASKVFNHKTTNGSFVSANPVLINNDSLYGSLVYEFNAGTVMNYFSFGFKLSNEKERFSAEVIKQIDRIKLNKLQGLVTQSDVIYLAPRFTYFFLPKIRLVGYNVMLSGFEQQYESIVTIPWEETNRILVEFDLGCAIYVDKLRRFKIDYRISGRSQEFSYGKKFHSWGRMGLTFYNDYKV